MPDDLELLHVPPDDFKIRCATHLFALPDSRPGWDDREVDGFRLQWL
jgi:hypothetical protein